MTDIFKSQFHQTHFNQHGYVVIDAGMEKELDEIERFIAPYIANLSSDFYYSLIANDLENNKRIRDKIRNALRSFYNRTLTNYKSLNESFLTKPANTTNELLLHQDWNYTYEDKFHSLTLWMPLCDVDENNGAVFLLSGSHKWLHNIRSCNLPTARISSKDLPGGRLLKIAMRKGQVLLFHPALFHGSYPNNSNQHRTIVTSVILPENADYVYFQATKDETDKNVKTFGLDEDAFLRELKSIAVGADPSTEAIEQFNYNHPVITPADLLSKVPA
jgi:phytanoyl-CoA dioxygenase PhyH